MHRGGGGGGGGWVGGATGWGWSQLTCLSCVDLVEIQGDCTLLLCAHLISRSETRTVTVQAQTAYMQS